MAGRGGYQRPSNPAPASGPGALSARTDGGPGDTQALSAPTGMDYGERQQMLAAERLAPMAATPQPEGQPAARPGPAPTAPASAPQFSDLGFDAASTRPDEPVTAGVDIGEGPGADGLSFQPGAAAPATGAMTRMLQELAPTDSTGVLAQLLQHAEQRGV